MLYPILAIVVFILDIIAIVSVMSGRSSVERKVLWVVIILLLVVMLAVASYWRTSD